MTMSDARRGRSQASLADRASGVPMAAISASSFAGFLRIVRRRVPQTGARG